MGDVWNNAYTFVATLESNSLFSSGAYSVIMSTSPNYNIQGYFFFVNYNYFFNFDLESNMVPNLDHSYSSRPDDNDLHRLSL